MEFFVFYVVHFLEARVLGSVLCAFNAGFFQCQRVEEHAFDGFGHFKTAFGKLMSLVGSNGATRVNMEVGMSAVKQEFPRSGLFPDGPRFDPGLDCSVDPDTGEELVSMTKQAFADECDINQIMKRMQATAVDPYMDNSARGTFGDASNVYDFAEAMNIVIEAEHNFSQLPATIRDRFGNDPAVLLEWLGHEDNREEAIKLGIVNPPPVEPAPQKVEVVSPPQPKAGDKPASGAAGTAAT